MAWRPHREGFASGRNPDPGDPRRRGPAACRAAPERAAAPHRSPGPRGQCLGPEKRRGNFGRNFANFALGGGEAARLAAAAAGRDARGGPRVRPGHQGAGRAVPGGTRGRPTSPGSPPRPRACPAWPASPGAPSGLRLAAPRMAGIENLALSASVLISLYLSTISLCPPDSSSFTASLSFVFLSPSVGLSHFLGI